MYSRRNEKRYSLRKQDFKIIDSVKKWGEYLRDFEISSTLKASSRIDFDNALELGCGAGRQAEVLRKYCKNLISSDYDIHKIKGIHKSNSFFVAIDAQGPFPFQDGEMDLIFSSNMIEHLPKVEGCLAECKRVASKDAVIIHTVPNRTWKLFHLLLFYPVTLNILFKRIMKRQKRNEFIENPSMKDDNLRPLENKRGLFDKIIPMPHGYSKNHFDEYRRFAEKRWIDLFESYGFTIEVIVRLPFYYGHNYTFPFLLKLGNYLGLSSSTAYILRVRQ